MFHSYTHKHVVWQFYMFVCVWESIHVCKTSHCSGNHCAPTADAGGTLSLRHLLPTAGPAVRTGRAEFVPAARCGGERGHVLTALGLNTHFSVRMERAEDTSCEWMQSERAVLSGHASRGGSRVPGYEHVYMWLGIELQRCSLAQCVRAARSRGLEMNDCLSRSARSVGRPFL